jgi:uncharacterized membrane protein
LRRELELALLVGWIAAATVALVWVWRISWPQDAKGTKQLAEEERRSRSTDTAVVLAAVASLGAVVSALFNSGGSGNSLAGASVALSIVAVVLSWALVNAVFALRYARLYYLDEDAGIDFRQEQSPAYSDFAYMAFTVGMAYAVSDTQPASNRIRKTALGHALLSYLFGTGVIATAINLVTNLRRHGRAFPGIHPRRSGSGGAGAVKLGSAAGETQLKARLWRHPGYVTHSLLSVQLHARADPLSGPLPGSSNIQGLPDSGGAAALSRCLDRAAASGLCNIEAAGLRERPDVLTHDVSFQKRIA